MTRPSSQHTRQRRVTRFDPGSRLRSVVLENFCSQKNVRNFPCRFPLLRLPLGVLYRAAHPLLLRVCCITSCLGNGVCEQGNNNAKCGTFPPADFEVFMTHPAKGWGLSPDVAATFWGFGYGAQSQAMVCLSIKTRISFPPLAVLRCRPRLV